MTAVVFKFTLPTGEPLVGRAFTVTLRKPGMFFEDAPQGITVPDDVVGVTDEQGKCTLELVPLELSYYLTMDQAGAEATEDNCYSGIRFRFRVPDSATPADIVDLIITEPTWSQSWDEKAIGVIIDAKVASIDAAERAKASELAAEADAVATAADRVAVAALTVTAGQHEINALNARDAAQAYATNAAASAQETDADRIATALLRDEAGNAATTAAAAAIDQLRAEISDAPAPSKIPRATVDGFLENSWLSPDILDAIEASKKTAVLLNYEALEAYTGSADEVRLTKTGIEGVFYKITSTSYSSNYGTLIKDALGRVWLRKYEYDVKVSWFGVKTGDNTPAVALANSEGLNRAMDFVGNQFPGRVLLDRGTTYVTDSNPTAVSWDNNRALYLRYSGIVISGRGVGVSILKLIDNANCTVIKIGSYVENTVVATRCVIENLQIDGSRTTQKVPSKTLDHFSGIAVSNNCEGTILRNLYVTDTAYYGIGLGQDGLSHCKVFNVETNRTGGDGLDWKSNSNNQIGGIIQGFRARNYGLLSLDNVNTPQAGLDIRSGVQASNINIGETTGPSGTVAIRIQEGTSGNAAIQPSTVTDWLAVGTMRDDSTGLRMIAAGALASRGKATGYTTGVSVDRLDSRLDDITSSFNAVGFRFWGSSELVEADTGSHKGLVARNNSQAGVICDSVDEITFAGCEVRNNGIGYDIRTGSTNIRILGGSCNGNTTENLRNLGERTVVRDVSGLRTKQRVSVSLPVGPSTTAGVKNIVATHTLAVVPKLEDVKVQFRRGTNIGDWQSGYLQITNAPTSTEVYAQVRLIGLSATQDAFVWVDFDIETLCTM